MLGHQFQIMRTSMPTDSSLLLKSYSVFLPSNFGNFIQTFFADNFELWSHDGINRQLRSQKWTPSLLRQYLRNQIQLSHQGYLLFDDTVLNKRHSHFIEMVRRQWSGNAHTVIPGIGVVTCVYVNPELQRCLVLDFRLFDPGRLDAFVLRQHEGDQSNRGGLQGLLLPSQAELTSNAGPGTALPTTGYSTLH